MTEHMTAQANSGMVLLYGKPVVYLAAKCGAAVAIT